jgi:PUB domain
MKEALECLETLEIIVKNLVEHPDDAKFKTIKEKSKALQRVLICDAGQDLLIFLGGLKKVHNFESHFVWESGLRIKDSELAEALPIINFYKTRLAGVPQETLKDRLQREKDAKDQILKDIHLDRIERLERIERQRISREMKMRADLEQQRLKLQQNHLTGEKELEQLEKRQKLAGRVGPPSLKSRFEVVENEIETQDSTDDDA